jgi:hypothetical protein
MTKRKDPKDLKKRGRKTKYRPIMCQKVDEYIKDCIKVEEGKERQLPSKSGVAIKFNVSTVTIDTWMEKYPEFLYALRKVNTYQLNQLENRGMNGTGNPAITKLLLSHNHGYKERSDVTSNDETIAIKIPEKFRDM